MKYKIIKGFSCTVITIVLLAGCADSVTQEESVVAGGTVEIEAAFAESEDAAEKIVLQAAVEVSDKKTSVYYAGENFVKSVFAAGGNMLFVCGIKDDGSYFLGYMQKEADVFQEFDVGMDEGMRAFDMVIDSQGRCHILWMSVEKIELNGQLLDRINYEQSCIMVVNSDGELEKEVDISDILASRRTRPFCFIVDQEGNYYVESEKDLIQIMPDGAQGKVTVCDGWIEGVGVGKSGAVYCTYAEESGERRLARLEGDGFRVCDVELPEAQPVYAGIYAGTDSEVLLFNKDSGIFAYDGDAIEVRVSREELPVTDDGIRGYDILSDGRACILSQENGTTVFYYIPLVK